MKKKLLSIVLALTLVFALVLPVSAVSASVQAVQDAYNAMATALENKDLEALRTATVNFEAVAENLTEEETEELYELLDEDFLIVMLEAASIVGTADMVDAFLAEPNTANAFLLVEIYDGFYGEEMADEEFNALLEAMIPNLKDAYTQALPFMPEQNVMEIYEAYLLFEITINWSIYDEEFVVAMEEFEAVVDSLAELSDEELSQLAELMGEEDGEAACATIAGAWADANVINAIGELYNAFMEDANAETAVALIEAYDSIYNTPDFKDEELGELIDVYFDIHAVYEEALTYVDGKDAADKDDKEDKNDKEDKEEVISPQTSDPTSYALPVVMLVIAAGAFVCLKKEKCN